MNAYKGFRCNTGLGGAPFSAAFTRPIDLGFQSLCHNYSL